MIHGWDWIAYALLALLAVFAALSIQGIDLVTLIWPEGSVEEELADLVGGVALYAIVGSIYIIAVTRWLRRRL